MKAALFYHFFDFQDDKLFQALAARNLASGEGLTYNEVHTNDLHAEIKVVLNRWPAGYSLAIAGLYKITGSLVISTLIFDLIFIIAFFLILRMLLKELEFPGYLINIIVLFHGFSIDPYISKPTDIHAVVFIMAGIYLGIKFYRSRSGPLRYGILIGVLSFLPSFLRYMYIPSSVIIGGILLMIGVMQKEKVLIRGAAYSLIVTVISITALLLFNKFYAGSSSYVMPMERGLFANNLLVLYPFLCESFINLNFILTQMQLRTKYDYSFWYRIVVYLNLLACVYILVKCIVSVRLQRLKEMTVWKLFLLMSLGIIISTILLTGYLSLVNGPYRITLKELAPWTFIGDGRYFAFPIIVVPVIVAYYLFIARSMQSGRFIIPAKYLFVFLIVFEVLHTGWFLIRNFKYDVPVAHATFPLPLKHYLKDRIDRLVAEKKDVVLTGHSENVALWGMLNGAKGLLNSDEIITDPPAIDKETILLIVINKKDKAFYEPFLLLNNAREDTLIGDFSIYSCQSEVNE